MKPVTAICGECGNVCDCPIIPNPSPLSSSHEFEYSFPECEECGAKGSGGNWRTGEVSHWTSAKDRAICQNNYEQQMIECDNNEWYGRGNW